MGDLGGLGINEQVNRWILPLPWYELQNRIIDSHIFTGKIYSV